MEEIKFFELKGLQKESRDMAVFPVEGEDWVKGVPECK